MVVMMMKLKSGIVWVALLPSPDILQCFLPVMIRACILTTHSEVTAEAPLPLCTSWFPSPFLISAGVQVMSQHHWISDYLPC